MIQPQSGFQRPTREGGRSANERVPHLCARLVAIEICVGELHRLDLLVQLHYAHRTLLVRLRVSHDVQHFQRSHTLPTGKKLVTFPPDSQWKSGRPIPKQTLPSHLPP